MDKKVLEKLSCLLLLCCLFAACEKENNEPERPITTSGEKLFVVCEGSYGTGNSALTLYLPEADTSYENYYQAVNSQTIGDVFQDLKRVDNHYILTVNNSDRVIITDTGCRYLGSITIRQPRMIVPLSSETVLISTLYSNKVFIINPNTLTITDSFSLPRNNAESILALNSKLYIACWDTACKQLYTLDAATYQLTDSLAIGGYAPSDIVADADGNLWILSGNVTRGKASYLTKTTTSGQILSTYAFPIKAEPLKLIITTAKDSLYFIEANYYGSANNNGIYRMGIHDGNLPATPFIQASALQYFWGLGIHPTTGYIYVADPLGFVQRGRVSIYNQQGQLQQQIYTGVGPGRFYFD